MKISRRHFIGSVAVAGSAAALNCFNSSQAPQHAFLESWSVPPHEFSQAPFWFWNDGLTEKEIARQMQDFCDHGVYGFVIHPRAGLPRDIGWMSDKMIHYMRYAIDLAEKKDMWVVLYDEGMYPSGSASGQVVAENRAYRPRGLFYIDLDSVKPGDEVQGFKIGADGKPVMGKDQNLITIVKRKQDGHQIAVVDRFISDGYSLIRGLHFVDPDAKRRPEKKEVPENMPELGDILNPEAMQCFIRLVYQRYYDEFSKHFGKTIKAVFTDEPSFFGKRGERGAKPGNADVLKFVNEWLGYDFTPHLAALWFDDEPDAEKYRLDYDRALEARLEETYYKPISEWCSEHNVALAGHPADPDDIGHLRYFHFPGQDIVWRYVEPGKPNALEGPQSTMGKCASSAMVHLGRRRNSNEYCGAYGHDFTFREMKWLANWLIVRGCNLLYPHAFYYSVRGPRVDERPPDVGPNNTWWGEFKPFADATSRLCWLNTDSKQVCDVAILGLNDYLPWPSAKVCFQNQIDFNYLEARHLWEDAKVDKDGIHIAGMHYKTLVVEPEVIIPEEAKSALDILEKAGRVIRWNPGMDSAVLVSAIDKLTDRDVKFGADAKDIRVRHVVKEGLNCYMIFNEGESDLKVKPEFSLSGKLYLLDIKSSKPVAMDANAPLDLPAHKMVVVAVDSSGVLG